MFFVLERYFDLEELSKNLNPQKNREGTWFSFKSMGESFLPIPERIFTISAIEFQGAACEGVNNPAFAKLVWVATPELLSNSRTSSPLSISA